MNTVATAIGFVFIFSISLLIGFTIGYNIVELARRKFPKFDLYLYDTNRRWNSRQRKK